MSTPTTASARSDTPAGRGSFNGRDTAEHLLSAAREVGDRFQEAVDVTRVVVQDDAGANGAAALAQVKPTHKLEGIVVAVPDRNALPREPLGNLLWRPGPQHERNRRRAPSRCAQNADPVDSCQPLQQMTKQPVEVLLDPL